VSPRGKPSCSFFWYSWGCWPPYYQNLLPLRITPSPCKVQTCACSSRLLSSQSFLHSYFSFAHSSIAKRAANFTPQVDYPLAFLPPPSGLCSDLPQDAPSHKHRAPSFLLGLPPSTRRPVYARPGSGTSHLGSFHRPRH